MAIKSTIDVVHNKHWMTFSCEYLSMKIESWNILITLRQMTKNLTYKTILHNETTNDSTWQAKLLILKSQYLQMMIMFLEIHYILHQTSKHPCIKSQKNIMQLTNQHFIWFVIFLGTKYSIFPCTPNIRHSCNYL